MNRDVWLDLSGADMEAHFWKNLFGRLVTVVSLAVLFFVGTPASDARFHFGPNVWRNSNDNHGLTDLKGREIIPAIYSDIEYAGHGLFLLRHRIDADKFTNAREKTVVNRSGVHLPVILPSQGDLDHFLWLGQQLDADQTLVPQKLPADALLVFNWQQKFGICNGVGQVVLPATYTWIGKAHGGVAILRRNAELYLFDIKTRQQWKLDCDDPNIESGIAFSEGLAPLRKGNLWGYMNMRGELVIEPRFHSANSFRNGQAYVTFLSADGKYATGAIMDKSGKVISAPQLGIDTFYGDYAVAGRGTGKVGVVNRVFEFVIKPEFKAIIPQPAPFYCEDDATSPRPTAPLFYYASKGDGQQPVVLSITGKVLFSLPKELHFPNWPPTFQNSAIACPVGPESPWSKVVYLNLEGNEIPAPYSNLSDSKSITFHEIAPGILMKTIKCSDQEYERELQRVNPNRGGNRFN